MTRMFVVLSLAAAAAASAGCGSSDATAPALASFDSASQMEVSYELTLFGGDGQWDIGIKATVKNTNAETRVLTLGGCPVPLLVYRTPSSAGTPAWDPSRRPGGCKAPPIVDTLAAGASVVITGTHTNTNEILGNFGQPNPPGQYYFFASLGAQLATPDPTKVFVGFTTLQ